MGQLLIVSLLLIGVGVLKLILAFCLKSLNKTFKHIITLLRAGPYFRFQGSRWLNWKPYFRTQRSQNKSNDASQTDIKTNHLPLAWRQPPYPTVVSASKIASKIDCVKPWQTPPNMGSMAFCSHYVFFVAFFSIPRSCCCCVTLRCCCSAFPLQRNPHTGAISGLCCVFASASSLSFFEVEAKKCVKRSSSSFARRVARVGKAPEKSITLSPTPPGSKPLSSMSGTPPGWFWEAIG